MAADMGVELKLLDYGWKGLLPAVNSGKVDFLAADMTPKSKRTQVLPQAVKLMIPPMGGVYVILTKGVSIVSVIAVAESVRAGDGATQRHPKEPMVIYGLTAPMSFADRYPVFAYRPLGRDQIRQRPVAVVSPWCPCFKMALRASSA